MPFHPPNIIQLAPERLVKWELITVTPSWPDRSWFPEIKRLATEPTRRFQPLEWLLWNAASGEAAPKS